LCKNVVDVEMDVAAAVDFVGATDGIRVSVGESRRFALESGIAD
jgi:hypothetical protein